MQNESKIMPQKYECFVFSYRWFQWNLINEMASNDEIESMKILFISQMEEKQVPTFYDGTELSSSEHFDSELDFWFSTIFIGCSYSNMTDEKNNTISTSTTSNYFIWSIFCLKSYHVENFFFCFLFGACYDTIELKSMFPLPLPPAFSWNAISQSSFGFFMRCDCDHAECLTSHTVGW